MKSNNGVSLIGSVTQPPKHDEGRKLIFSVGGTMREASGRETSFYHEVIIPGKQADAVAAKISQNSAVRVSGTLSESTWEKDGQKHSKLQVKTFDVDLLHREDDDYVTDSVGGKRLGDASSTAFIIGNVGAAPQVKEDGTRVTRVRVAVSEGGEEKQTHWITVVGFDDHAESLSAAQKGDRLYVEGVLISESWKTPEGKSRNSTSLKATRIEYVLRAPTPVQTAPQS